MAHLPATGMPPVTIPHQSRTRGRPLLLAALAVPVVGWVALLVGGAQPLRGPIERYASEALGRKVTIDGNLRILVTPFSISLTAGNVRVANPRWAMEDDFLRVTTLTARLSTFDLMIGRSGVRALDLRGGTLDLERSRRAGRTNWAIGKPGTLFDLASVQQIGADDLAVRFRDFAKDSDTRLALADDGAGRVTLSGAGRIAERRFTLQGTAQSAEDQPARFDLAARTGGIDLALQSTADRPFQLIKAPMRVSARGGDFAELAALAGIDTPAMPGFAFKARLRSASKSWHLTKIDGRIGQTDLAGKLTLDQRAARPRVVAQLASQSLHLGDGMTLLGLHGDPATAIPAAYDAGPIAPTRARLLPDADLSAKALQRFDAVIDYVADRITGAPHAPSHLTMKLALVRGRLMVSPASVDLAGGFVSTDLLIDARRSPALTRADIRLSPTPMGRLLYRWGIAPAGTTAMVKGRIQLAGRGTTLRSALAKADGRIALTLPAGDVRTQRASTSSLDMANLGDAIFLTGAAAPVTLNCGLIAFTVRDGIATSDPILIDTDGAVLSGQGRIDLRDERLDLRLTANSKDFGFFARPYPVTIGGTLSNPLVEREAISWFRPANFFGLPLALPDLGAIFGFVDPDDAGPPACGPILRGSTAAAQHDRGTQLASLR